jgi:hypothetical protein
MADWQLNDSALAQSHTARKVRGVNTLGHIVRLLSWVAVRLCQLPPNRRNSLLEHRVCKSLPLLSDVKRARVAPVA